MHRSKNLERIGPRIKGTKIEHQAVVCFNMKHFHFDSKTCSCSAEEVNVCHECPMIQPAKFDTVKNQEYRQNSIESIY